MRSLKKLFWSTLKFPYESKLLLKITHISLKSLKRFRCLAARREFTHVDSAIKSKLAENTSVSSLRRSLKNSWSASINLHPKQTHKLHEHANSLYLCSRQATQIIWDTDKIIFVQKLSKAIKDCNITVSQDDNLWLPRFQPL